MTRIAPVLVSALLLVPLPALSCEPPPVYYEPMAVSNGAGRVEITEFVTQNAPVVRDVSLGRGTAAQSSLCGGQGYVSLTVALPPGASVTFADVGLEMRVVEGSFPEYALPTGPIRSTFGPNEDFQHLGSWFEGPPSKHKTISAVLHVSFIAPDGTMGPATPVTLFSEPEKPKISEGESR